MRNLGTIRKFYLTYTPEIPQTVFAELLDRQILSTLFTRLCYAYSPNGAWTSSHQMSVNGKKSGITDDDLMATGRIADLKPRLATKIIGEVREAVRNWPTFAEEAEVREEFRVVIGARLGRGKGPRGTGS